ncbi:MAG TPA: DEAD/DEAH box helicase [Myxococcota bacterium]|nr:DEAD/DEAH box helicase [Myxococcota bacterium]HNZ03670.1 DEAD/DEAH box helicase [Myxococcota bacterium]
MGNSFDSFDLPAWLHDALKAQGFESAMEVQQECFGPAMEGRDLVVQSRTGSGKTLAFVLPIVARVQPRAASTPQVLILGPTRELALQVYSVVEKLGTPGGIRSACVYGGTGFSAQLTALAQGVDIVVGTPGRILDHARRGTLKLGGIKCAVLDEADEMLSAGFYEDVRSILKSIRDIDQMFLFSATIEPGLENLISDMMVDPVKVNLSGDRIDVDRIENVAYLYTDDGPRIRSLVSVLESEDPAAAIIFCNTRKTTESVTAYLRRRGYDAALLNSDLPQHQREEVIQRMRDGRQNILVATDIAARGIDISFLPCVIHFDLPDDTQQYIHRTGRTGRVDRRGRAVSLLSARDLHNVRRIEYRYGIKLERAELPGREETLKMLSIRRIRELKERLDCQPVIPDEFTAIAKDILTDPEAEQLIALLVDSYLASAPIVRPDSGCARDHGQDGEDGAQGEGSAGQGDSGHGQGGRSRGGAPAGRRRRR